MEIPLTFHCNNNCISCIIDNRIVPKKGDLTWTEIKKRIDRLPKPYDTVGIAGGEPTTSKNLFRCLTYIRDTRSDIFIFLVTNGRLFSYPDFAKRISNLGLEKLRVGIALYSHKSDIHDSITRCMGSWEQTTQGINNLLKLGIRPELRIIVSKLNYASMEDTARFIAKNLSGVERVVFINMKYTGNAFRNRKKIFIKYKELVPHITKAVDVLLSAGIETRLFHFPLCTISEEYRELAKGVTKQRGELAFAKACKDCKSRNDCPMIWRTYMILAGEDEFKPI